MFCLNDSFGFLNFKKISTIHLGVKLFLLFLIWFNQSERANISRDVYLAAPPQNPSPFTLHHIHCSGNNSCKYFVLVVFWFYQYLVVCICSIWIIHFKLGFFQYLVVCICCMSIIYFICVLGRLHFILYLILYPLSGDLTFVKTPPPPFSMFFFIVK